MSFYTAKKIVHYPYGTQNAFGFFKPMEMFNAKSSEELKFIESSIANLLTLAEVTNKVQ